MQFGTPAIVQDLHALEHIFHTRANPIGPVEQCVFRHAPDQEVQWWVDQLLATPQEHVGHALEQVPLYSQYIRESTLE